jgi:hypothetical protein
MKISDYFYIFSKIGSYIQKYALNIIFHENILFQKKYHVNSDYKLNNDDQIFHHEKNHEKLLYNHNYNWQNYKQ